MMENDSIFSPTKPSAGRGTPRPAIYDPDRTVTENTYTSNIAYAVFLGLSLIFYGSVLLMVLNYSSLSGDSHAILCFIGFSFLCGLAILSFNVFNGWSYVLKLHHRKIVHACLNVLGLAFGIAGTVMVLTLKSIQSIHGVLGLITMLFAISGGILGPCIFHVWENNDNRRKRKIHVILGIITLSLGALTIIIGFLMGQVNDHLGGWAQFLSIMITFLYTLAILLFVCPRCRRFRPT